MRGPRRIRRWAGVALVVAGLFAARPDRALAGAPEEEAPAAAESGGLPGGLPEWLDLSAISELEWAYETDEDRAQKLELSVLPEMRIDLPGELRFVTIGRMRADAYDRLERGKPGVDSVSDWTRPAFTGDQLEYELREAYLEVPLATALVVVGKQQVVWGRSDGLKVLDVVNPQSFREFILEDFDQSRIPLWSLRVEAPIDSVDVDFVWIPDKSYHRFAGEGGAFEFLSPEFRPQAQPGTPALLRDADRPSRFFEDSDVGARIGSFVGGWDLSFNYLYHYHDAPILFVAPGLVNGAPGAVVTPEYRRTHLVGGTASNAFGDLGVRAELAFSSDRYFTADVARERDAVVQSEEISYVLGFDWYGVRDTLISLQFFQSALTDDPDGLERDQVDSTITLLARRSFWNERIEVDGIWLTNLNHGDGLLRGELRYEFSDEVTAWVGYDWFYGSRNGLFGQFDRRDRFTLGLRVGI